MTDTEIDRRLALAIGYLPEHVQQTLGRMVIVNRPVEVETELWVEFDHTEWGTISPIAARYDCFPERVNRGDWVSYMLGTWLDTISANTPQKAIALAVIAAHEAGVLR